MKRQIKIKTNTVSELHSRLDDNEPWTQTELDSYTPQDRAFIRNLQLKDKSSKDKAKNKFIRYAQKSKTAFKKLGRDTRKFIKEHYPKHQFITTTKTEFKKPKVKRGFSQNTEVKQFLKSNKSRKQKTFSRVLKASKKYPYASKYELQHGINSVASQKYRSRHKNDK